MFFGAGPRASLLRPFLSANTAYLQDACVPDTLLLTFLLMIAESAALQLTMPRLRLRRTLLQRAWPLRRLQRCPAVLPALRRKWLPPARKPAAQGCSSAPSYSVVP